MNIPRAYRIPLLAFAFLFVMGPVVDRSGAARADDEPAKKIRVLVWDEQQKQQKQAYGDKFLGETIAAYLAQQPGLDVRTARFDDPEQGLSKELLDNAQVLIWWGHVRNAEVKEDKGKEIVARIKAGQLSLIALHSAHWSSPFMAAMNARTIDDALNSLPESERATAKLEFIKPKPFTAPKRDAPLTPSFEKITGQEGGLTLKIALPNCVFPAYRADGKPSHVKTLLTDHPIAKGIPAEFDIPQTEMYDEPFHVPKPDAVIFEEHWDLGEHFRSGCVWQLGKGRVFYFRPGHETYPVYKEAQPLKIVENAVRWLGE